MKPKFDPLSQEAVEKAKSATSVGSTLNIDMLFRAMLHTVPYSDDYSYLTSVLDEPNPKFDKDRRVKPEDGLKDVFMDSIDDEGNIKADNLFRSLLFSDELESRLPQEQLPLLHEARQLNECLQFRDSSERKKLVSKLNAFGTMISDKNLKVVNLCGRERFFAPICRTLMRMMRNDALLVSPAGVGKSALIREFARLVANRDESIPRALHGAEVFQLSHDLLRAGAVSRPQFQNRVKSLKELLESHPKVILLINPMDALIAKDTRRHENLAAEEAIRELISCEIPVIACMGPGAYLLMESRLEWDAMFDIYKIPEPDPERVPEILEEMIPDFTSHYSGLQILPTALPAVAKFARQLHPNRCEPRRSVQFLDDICVRAMTCTPPILQLDREQVEKILEEPLASDGVKIQYSSEELFGKLSGKIMGQGDVLTELSSMISTRMSKWASQDRPRGVFLFGGPTGVGKTETAVQLAELLTGGPNNLIRVNCNTLQPTGNQKTSVIWPLIGVPAGYVGHGEGGILSKIREKPNTVVLFDEFEKADPAVGKLLLQIIDTGLQDDNNGVTLDFRQSFIVFTSNLGVDYEGAAGKVGFAGSSARTRKKHPKTEEEQLRNELKLLGYGPEFIGRVHKIFLFKSLTEEAISSIIKKQIEYLSNMVSSQGFALAPARDFPSKMAKSYVPRDGVRGMINRLRADFTRAMSDAEVKGDLNGVSTIALRHGDSDPERVGDALIVYLK
jgi:ATP-dependent Clp protease ATP-binding subunit ClpA